MERRERDEKRRYLREDLEGVIRRLLILAYRQLVDFTHLTFFACHWIPYNHQWNFLGGRHRMPDISYN